MVTLPGWAWQLAAPLLVWFLATPSCDQSPSTQDITASPLPESNQTQEASQLLYATLPSKMARMEEILNSIDRFLGDPDFAERLLTDAHEFHRLLHECRTLYPEALETSDQLGFSQAIDQTSSASQQLLTALQKQEPQAARQALAELDRLRRRAHAKFSY